MLPHWRFAIPQLAQQSSQAIYAMFLAYLEAGDFVGQTWPASFSRWGTPAP